MPYIFWGLFPLPDVFGLITENCTVGASKFTGKGGLGSGYLGRYSYILLPIISPSGSFISAGFAIITLLHEADPPPPPALPLLLLYLIVPQASRQGFLIFLINFILFCLHCRLGSAVAEGGNLEGNSMTTFVSNLLKWSLCEEALWILIHVRCPKSFSDFWPLPLVLNLSKSWRYRKN
jgi:hypothetical protein